MGVPQLPSPVQQAGVPLERDVFLRTLVRHLAGTLQEVVGLKEATGFASVVGQRMGEEINGAYKRALQVGRWSRRWPRGTPAAGWWCTCGPPPRPRRPRAGSPSGPPDAAG
jgi:hypothetical protein